MFIAEDQLMFLRCLLGGAKVVHTPGTIAFYRLGDAGKLTESAAASSRRVTDWLWFLERAVAECRTKDIEPGQWLGFDRRLWVARRLLSADSLTEYGPACRLLYPIMSAVDRWCGGLKMRLKGDRQNVSFQCGPITYDYLKLFPAS
jgi:hypothetical protein